MRIKDLVEHNNQSTDLEYSRLTEYYLKNYVGLETTKNGNCLFHAVSLNLFEYGLNSFKIKIATVYVCFEYENFIKTFLKEYYYW